jgi:VWFA-related protein
MTRNQVFPPLLVSILSLACLPAALPAQQALPAKPARSSSGDSAQTSLKSPAKVVLLQVTARDKKGALLTSLDKGDLTLSQDGRPQTIASFTHDAALPYRLGLLVDTSRGVSYALEPERKAAGQFVDAMLPDQPQAKDPNKAFLLHFDREVELLEDFTTSREKLHGELDDVSTTHVASRDDSEGPETTGEDRERPTRGRNNAQLYDAIFLACDELMKNQQGRKALVIFSDGVDRGSKDTLNDAVDAADRAGVEIYTIYMRGHEEDENPTFPRNNRRGGMGYPGGGGGYPGGGGGYPGGGGQQKKEPKSIVDGKKIMQEIARRTGGHAFEAKKGDDLQPIYKLIAEELHGQYVLTYTPDKADNEGGFHKIELKANKGDLQVTTREGYYAPGGEESK